jgi:hypothetical protein
MPYHGFFSLPGLQMFDGMTTVRRDLNLPPLAALGCA